MRYAVDRYKIGSESEVDAEKFSGCLYIPNRRNRFYCPECGEIVFFRDKGGAHPSHFFHQEKTDKTPECDKRVDGRSELSLRERVGLPIYLIRMYGEEFQLNLGFPSLGKELLAKVVEGLQADYVFIINNKDRGMGFPSKIQDDPLVDRLLEGKETFPFAEERRLFYVALTRAKVKAYLVVVKGNESGFASEMEHKYGDRLKDEWFTCPRCGGRLVKRKGQYGEFYGCSNYRQTNCRFTRKIKAHTVEQGA